MTDQTALDKIAEILSGEDWAPETLNLVADVIRSTDREVNDLS